MEVLFRDFQHANHEGSGPLLAATISPIAPSNYLNRLEAIYRDSNAASITRDISYGLTKSAKAAIQYPNPEISAWTEIYVAYWNALGEVLATQDLSSKPDWNKVYEAWKDLANTVIKGYSSSVLEAWTLPVLYTAGKHLRVFAIKADETARASGSSVDFNTGGLQEDIASDFGKNEHLEDAARVINRMFTLCISDRAPLEESRKWGLYYITNLLFKTYFKLNSIGLSKNILRALSASRTDMPELEAFPRSHIVTFKYYVGVIQFLEEDYAHAEENLTSAWHMCHRSATRNVELILTYLIPTRLLTVRLLPSSTLLDRYPRLSTLFSALSTAIRTGSLSDFDTALAEGEADFVKRRIYLTLERGRDICLRNLLRKVYLAAGVDEAGNRRTRIRVDEFSAAIRIGEGKVENGEKGEVLENDEVECLVSNMIYKNLMKGYISRPTEARPTGIVVLSKTGAFPGTGI
ncbi:COP9 signalosome (CSN) subunit [Mycoblastus sanguinarius]|nr:COP9 signalosome (CSN) subunit [Mycoblastus sanguinarius]